MVVRWFVWLIVVALGVVGRAPLPAEAQDYVGSESCIACHTEAAKAWEGSHHALAWSAPSAATLRADFDGTSFTLGEMQARFSLDEDGKPKVSVTERDGVTTDYAVHSVIGVEPLQQYILETEPGRLQSFDVVWDTEQGEWFHLYPAQNYAPEDGLHWTGPYKTWNSRCAACHATGFKANYQPQSRSFASTQVEMGVGCEACHGPGAAHLSWADTREVTQAAPPENYGFSVDMSDPEQRVEQCASCHSRREAFLDGNPVPGTAFHDAYNLSWLREGAYEVDGQILDEVFVYGSFLQSKMYAEGVTCQNCHLPHEAELIAEGNGVCTQCHSPAGNPEFPTLPREIFDGPEHTHHPVGSTGAECKSCHMVERTYMGNDLRADHSFRIPRPDLAEATGAPDACTGCHEDESADWAAATLATWFPESSKRGPHYGEVLAHGRRNPSRAAPELRFLAQDREAAALVRATALYLLDRAKNPEDAAMLEALTADPDPLVRSAAVRLQRVAPARERVPRILGALSDPSRSVRIAAAQSMMGTGQAHLPIRYRETLHRALGEWQASMNNRLDYPETRLQLGGTALAMRDLGAAAKEFAEATRLDPQLADAWVMRVRIAMARGDTSAGRALLDEALDHLPNHLALQAMRSQLTGQQMDLLPPAAKRE
ncbi:multiheme c-type cytochrome [Roseovarius sp. C7]|uniref:multiheme c-type cytochrome n=1 Tax=Roseovarius sp. C7 TaxID=3398643 RepID=UPI0039F55601